jgi:hypothetical protein
MSEKTISEFLKEMADAGFTFDYRATNGEMTFVGKCVKSGSEYTITHRRVQTVAESKAKIKELLK